MTETVALDLGRGGSAQLALGFATTQTQALDRGGAASATRFDKVLARV